MKIRPAACRMGTNLRAAVTGIRLTKYAGPPTGEVTVSPAAEPNEPLDLAFDGLPLTSARAAEDGSISVSVHVPAEARPGKHVISMTGARGTQRQIDFTVRTDWATSSFDGLGSSYNPCENVLSASNVASLTPRWGLAGAQGVPLVASGRVYVASSEGRLLCLDASTHRLLWTSDMLGVESITISDNRAFVTSGYRLLAFPSLCRADGGVCSPLWYAAVNGVKADPAIAGHTVYVTGAFSEADYAPALLAFPTQCRADGGECKPLFKAKVPLDPGGNLITSPVVSGDTVYTALGVHLYAMPRYCAAGSGCAPKWSYAVQVASQPTVAGDSIFANRSDPQPRTLVAMPAHCKTPTCGPLWTASVETYGRPAVANDVVYTNGVRGKLYAFDVHCRADGAECAPRWVGETGEPIGIYSAPVVANGLVYVSGLSGQIHVFDVGCASATCSPLFSFRASYSSRSFVYSSHPVITDGALYITSFTDRRLHVFDLKR